MTQFEKDYLTLMEAYQKNIEFAKGQKKTCQQTPSAIMKTARQYLGLLSIDDLPECQSKEVVKNSKHLFQRFLEWYKRNPAVFSDKDYEDIDSLMDLVGLYEAGTLEILRMEEVCGDRIDMEKIFFDVTRLRQVLMFDAVKLVREALSDEELSPNTGEDTNLYITMTGAKYHRIDCPYCGGRQLYPITRKKIENIGIAPCWCVPEKALYSRVSMLPKEEKSDVNQHTITVFVDESVRGNQLHKIDPSLDEVEGVYSYLICKGYLESESEAQSNRILKKRAAVADDAKTTTDTTIAGIQNALMWAAMMLDFHGDVVVYTDNSGAVDLWRKTSEYVSFEKQFSSISISQISRDQNKMADQLGRKKIFMQATSGLLSEIVKRFKNWETTEQELKVVKQYFPHPTEQIPLLIRELGYLTGE